MSARLAAGIRVAALLVVAIVLQTAVAPNLRVEGVAPDLMLLLAICGGLAGGARYGATVGFAAGLLSDLFLVATPFGLSALTYCLVGFVVGVVRALLVPENRLVIPLIAALASAGGVILFVLLGALARQSDVTAPGPHWVARVAIVEALDAAILAWPVSWLFDRASLGSGGAASLGRVRSERVALR